MSVLFPMQQELQKQILPGRNISCWVAGAPSTDYPQLEGDNACETLVVGGGIVGLTVAMELLRFGKIPVVLEARRIGRQVTGLSSAKITAQHALIYRHIIETFGLETARFYADANRAAMGRIDDWINNLGIRCSYEKRGAYCYCHDSRRREEIESEAEAAREVGFDARVLDHAPLPFDTAGALFFSDQAQFNPASYLVGLAQAVEAGGGKIFESSPARTVEDAGERWRVETDDGKVESQNIVIATNLTIKSPVGYANRTQPRCHVAMGFELKDPDAIDGMFISFDEPTHSIRTGLDPEGPVLLTLGPRFNTGHDGNVARRFEDLEEWTRRHLPAGEARWRWCNEDFDTEDRLPFVGQPDPAGSPGFYVATGFNAWGITNGTAAGMMITSEVVTGSHSWGPLFDAARPSSDDFNSGGDTQSKIEDVDTLLPGEGGVIDKDGEKIAVWRDDEGALHALSASCTHKGCTVTWNNADRTWDCPCHGSVFEADGTVFHGPARVPLVKRNI